MGSSKKHKEKDRGGGEEERRRGERGERRPRGHRSRSRSRDRDRDRERDRTRSRRERRERGERGERGEDASAGGPPPEKRVRRDHDEGDEGGAVTEGGDVPAPKSASGNNSLSIEETNKLRAKLGLKPLETSDAAKQSEEGSSKDNPVLFHPENLASIKKKAVLKEKLAALKEKRLINQKLGKVRTLAEEEDWLDDAAVWVQRSRKLQQEKDMAQKRAKVLEEMDAEFGISSLVEEEMGAKKEPSYTSKDLTGLSVEHDIETFQEGQTVILTLKDKAILDEEDGDVLVNVNMVDKEKADKNVELKKKKPVYQPYEEDESVDDLAIMRQRAVLSKYDEEIDGEKRKSFQLEHGGTADGSWERELQSVRDTLRSQAQRLETAVPQIANEFYSPEEMVTFRKTKRRVKKIRRREKTLRADQLAPLPGKTSGVAASDLGSRRRQGALPPCSVEGEGEQAEGESEEVRGDGRGGEERQEEGHDADTTVQDMQMSDDEEELVTPASPVVVEEDEAEQELQRQLDKQRRLRQKRDLRDAAIRVATVVRSMQSGERRGENDGGEDEEEDDEEGMVLGERDRHGHIVFNSTSEFCRTLGEIPTYGLSGNRDDRDDLLDFEQSDSEMRADEEDEEGAGWSAVNLEEERERVETPTGAGAILEEEPMITGGLASALKLCNTKGYLETEIAKMARVKNPHKTLPSALYTIEDKNHGSDDKYSRREEYRAYGQEFKDKEHYRPDVRIEYVDETGRKLTPKEAFRQLSHRFHGKGSGRMKTEKRQKKLEEEHMLRKMSSSDTPLGTVALLQEKQKAQKTPFIILSGSGKSMNANTITK